MVCKFRAETLFGHFGMQLNPQLRRPKVADNAPEIVGVVSSFVKISGRIAEIARLQKVLLAGILRKSEPEARLIAGGTLFEQGRKQFSK